MACMGRLHAEWWLSPRPPIHFQHGHGDNQAIYTHYLRASECPLLQRRWCKADMKRCRQNHIKYGHFAAVHVGFISVQGSASAYMGRRCSSLPECSIEKHSFSTRTNLNLNSTKQKCESNVYHCWNKQIVQP